MGCRASKDDQLQGIAGKVRRSRERLPNLPGTGNGRTQRFAFALVFRNADTDETYEVSIWEDEEALRESEKEGGVVEWKTNTLESITGSDTVVENYELRLIT